MPVPQTITLLLAAVLLSACGKENTSSKTYGGSSSNLRLVEELPLNVEEPSGLCLGADKKSLWSVSDDDGSIYQLNLQGEVVAKIQTGLGDIEAIAVMDETRVAVVAERTRQIGIFDIDGSFRTSIPIQIPGSDNSGPEALAYVPDETMFYVIQESPGTFIKIDIDGTERGRSSLRFSMDYSSIFFEPERKHFWVLSDRSKTIQVLDQDQQIQASFSIDIQQMEGLAVDHTNRRLYIVSDPLERLFVFEFDAY